MGKFHVSLVIAIVTLTVLSTGTVLHNAHAKPLDMTNGLFHRTWNTVSGLVSGSKATPVSSAKTTQPVVASPAISADTQSSSNVTQSDSNQTLTDSGLGWTQDDLSQLMTIATQLYTSLTPSDLLALGKDLSTERSDPAEQKATDADVLRVLQSHLSPEDLAWVQAHFTGEQAFTSADVQLLQRTVSELTGELTPAEQKLLSQGLDGFLSGQSLK